jgi:hypothetical protein
LAGGDWNSISRIIDIIKLKDITLVVYEN